MPHRSPLPTDLAGERLVRKTPDRVLPLGQGDLDYIQAGLEAIRDAFGADSLPGLPLDRMPGRALMRWLVGLRAGLRPRGPEQSEAWGRLAGAILIVDNAGDFASQHADAERRRLQLEQDDLEE